MPIFTSKSDVEQTEDGEGELDNFPASVRDESSLKADHGNPSAKPSNQQPYLDVSLPIQSVFARASATFSERSTYSADNENERRTGRLLTLSSRGRLLSRSPAPSPRTWKEAFGLFWAKNKGLSLVIFAQLFGVMMNVANKLLETSGTSGPGMHPFQILFARMIGTMILSGIYQWWAKVDGAPFGSKELRGLLLARGIAGFIAVYGVYYSLQYLPLSDAVVITFLAPNVACWACSIFIHEPFTRNEQIAGTISFLGVVLIARPASLLPHHSGVPPVASGTGDGIPSLNITTPAGSQAANHATSAQRLSAVAGALIGVVGAAAAFTTIRWIGKRAHPLVSMNYFVAWTIVISAVALLAVPDIDFRLPVNLRQWIYLVSVGICGFVMQFALTAGLQYEKSSRATNMVYTQMLFALAFDKLVFDTTPGAWGIAGSSLILGSALYVALLNNKNEKKRDSQDREDGIRDDEEVALVVNDIDADQSGADVYSGTTGPWRASQDVQMRTIRM